jgi:hypothetical protein
MPALYTFIGLLLGTALGWFLATRRASRSGDPIRKHPPGMEEKHPYRLSPALLTTSENACYCALLTLVPAGQVLLAKVRLADLLQVTYGAGNRSIAHGRIGNKVLDFLICDHDLAPLQAIQLEASTPDRAEVQAREFLRAVCEKVGLPLLRLPLTAHYDPAEIRAALGNSSPAVATAHGDTAKSPARHSSPFDRERLAH